MASQQRILQAMYPEVAAGGFARTDGSVHFYNRVRSLIRPTDVVLDFGAGRGRASETAVDYSRQLQDLRGHARRVIGVDVDSAVHENGSVDEALTMPDPMTIPLESGSIDVVVSNWVFEHVNEPREVANELDRVLKPGGWICARTPNKWGYWAVGARLISNRAHVRILRWLDSPREDKDVFPTRYLMNTRRALLELFPGYTIIAYGHVPPPHVGPSVLVNRLMRMLLKLLPEAAATNLFVFLRKAEDG